MGKSGKDRSGELALAMRILLRAYDRYRSAVAHRSGLGLTDIIALGHLYVDGPQSIGELAAELSVTSGAATQMIDRLEKAGVAQRHPHPTDRRKRLIMVTPDGERMAASYFADLATRLFDANAALTPSQHDGLDHFFAAVTAGLSNTDSLMGAG